MDSDFTKINSTEESFLAFAFFFLNPIGFFIASLILVLMVKKLRKGINDIIIKYAMYCAMGSVLFQILLYFNDIFLANDLIIKWNYMDADFHWATITDIFSTVFYSISKILFYFTFTFHVLSVFTNQDDRKMILFLKIWMTVVGVIAFIAMIVVAVNDSTTNSPKETGFTSPHNLYVTMVASHKGAKIAKFSIAGIILFDIIYFIVLIVVYIKKLKFLQNKHGLKDKNYLNIGTKGVNLVIFSCLTFWIFFICVLADIPIKWWGAFDITSDTLCLFLMFDFSNDIYDNLCGCCHKFWGNRIHGNQMQSAHPEIEVKDQAY